MQCRECGATVQRLDNQHTLACCGLTVHEYAMRHHQSLDLLLHPDQVDCRDDPAAYPDLRHTPDESARAVLRGLRWAGLLRDCPPFTEVPGEVRRIDLLLWDLQHLAGLGFQFRQDYSTAAQSHRVVAKSCLRVPSVNLRRADMLASTPPPDYLDALAVFVAHVAEYHAGYLFLPFAEQRDGRDVATYLRRHHQIELTELTSTGASEALLLRCTGLTDAQRLLELLRERLAAIPEGWSRFDARMPESTVTKQLVFDAAHFITDHPAKCSNLHGGRYVLEVSVSGRVDPCSGCVVDYGYLKRVVNQRVVERFDHHTLNYAAAELAWRSSTEMLCVFIWEQLIEYLPGLSGLRLFETTQSWCDYRGPDLAEFQRDGSHPLLTHFQRDVSPAARRLLLQPDERLKAVSG